MQTLLSVLQQVSVATAGHEHSLMVQGISQSEAFATLHSHLSHLPYLRSGFSARPEVQSDGAGELGGGEAAASTLTAAGQASGDLPALMGAQSPVRQEVEAGAPLTAMQAEPVHQPAPTVPAANEAGDEKRMPSTITSMDAGELVVARQHFAGDLIAHATSGLLVVISAVPFSFEHPEQPWT